MLSSAASPPLRAPTAAKILYIRAPSPSRPRPQLAGSSSRQPPRPFFPSRDGARRRPRRRLLCRPGGSRAGTTVNTLFYQSYRSRVASAHPRAASGFEPTAARSTPVTYWGVVWTGLTGPCLIWGYCTIELTGIGPGPHAHSEAREARAWDPPP